MSIGPVNYDLTFWGDYLDAQQTSLPSLPRISQLSDRVIRILGGNPGRFALQGTNTYLVGTGHARILIDTGQGMKEWIASLRQVLDTHSVQISHVLLTHWHGDHVGGIPDLLRHNYAQSNANIYKNNPDKGQLDISDGQIFAVEGATVEATHLPGHATDHTCFILHEESACFTGDNILGHGASTSEHLSAYIRSLRRMAAMPCQVGYPGHGAQIADLKGKVRQYLQLQHARQEQICKTLQGGDATEEELAVTLLGMKPGDMRKSLIEPILEANVWALAAEGRLGFRVKDRKRRWYLRPQRNHQ